MAFTKSMNNGQWTQMQNGTWQHPQLGTWTYDRRGWQRIASKPTTGLRVLAVICALLAQFIVGVAMGATGHHLPGLMYLFLGLGAYQVVIATGT